MLNVGLSKVFRLGGEAGIDPCAILGVSAENVTDRVNFADFNGVVTSPLFGTANRALATARGTDRGSVSDDTEPAREHRRLRTTRRVNGEREASMIEHPHQVVRRPTCC